MEHLECPVCYETFEHGELCWLECLHRLCKQCLKKLERKVCPLCRKEIDMEYFQHFFPPKERGNSITYTNVFVRVRRRRRRRTYVDRVSVGNVSVVMESFDNDKYSRKNFNKGERNKRGKWANSRRQTYGGRKRYRG